MKRLALTAATAALSMAAAHAQICSRESLKATAGAYFRAIEAHNPALLSTAANVRFTENGKELRLGEGFFKNGGKLLFQRNLIDSERCGTLTEAVVEENQNGTTGPILMAVRLKVDSGKVSEIETIITRKGEMFFNPQGVLDTKDQDWESILPPSQRSSRAYMNDAANKYFDGFTNNPTVEAPFATPCHRWEGGVQTTAKTGDCSPKGLVLTHTHRRFPITDVEAGITAGFVNFNQTLPDVHMFKIRNGKIELVQAVFGGRTSDAIWPDEKTPAAVQTSAQYCGRECLRGMITRYLKALVAHDPKSLPLAANVRFTEDTVEKQLGEGIWKTATGLGTFRQDIIDARQLVAGTHVVLLDNGMPVLYQVRLKIAGGKISEIDSTVVHNQTEGMIFRPGELTAASPAMNVTPDRSQLNSREEMTRLALLYPAGLKVGSFVKVDAQFAPDTYRLENGQIMAGPKCTFMPGCTNIKEQRLPTLAGIVARVAAVDEEQGIVWLRMSFGPGSLFGKEGTLMVWEMFKVYGGQIHAVEAFMKTAPLGTGFGWDL